MSFANPFYLGQVESYYCARCSVPACRSHAAQRPLVCVYTYFPFIPRLCRRACTLLHCYKCCLSGCAPSACLQAVPRRIKIKHMQIHGLFFTYISCSKAVCCNTDKRAGSDARAFLFVSSTILGHTAIFAVHLSNYRLQQTSSGFDSIDFSYGCLRRPS